MIDDQMPPMKEDVAWLTAIFLVLFVSLLVLGAMLNPSPAKPGTGGANKVQKE